MRREQPHPRELFQQAADLAEKTDKNRKDMIRAELSTITSFCDRAETSFRLGRRPHADKMLAEATKGVLTAKDQIDKLSAQDADGAELKKALNDVETRLQRIKKAA